MNEEFFIQKVINLEEDMRQVKESMGNIEGRMENMEGTMNNLLQGQDTMVGILQRIDQERAFTNIRMERLENEVEKIKR